MQIYLAIKYHSDASNRPLIEMISRAAEAPGRRTFCVARDLEQWGAVGFEADDLMRRTFSMILASDALLVDVTEKGVGLGIEAGFAAAKGIPILSIARAGTNFPNTLSGISTALIRYGTEDDLREGLVALFENGSLNVMQPPLNCSVRE